ncbi:MAG TPA: type 1 glutamine amidotransferase [Ilumatobacter sp.]|nr:type 1 glutamine amidotransferase [Ilumatobacter sp.]
MAELPDPAFSVAGPMTALYRQLFHGHAVEVLDVPVHEGATPASLADCDGWMISGSPASVYDDLDWIRTGEEIVRAAHAEERPLIGICFGHQLIAQALGGRVEKSAGGWGVGARAYDVVRPLPHFDGDTITLLASHQDQVVELPSEATVWSSSDYCPVAGFTIGERLVTVQGHPEYTPALVAALYESRRARIGDDAVDAALASLTAPLSNDAFADAVVHLITG